MQDIILHNEPQYYNETTTFQRKCKYNDDYIYLIAEYIENEGEIERHICILSRQEYPYEIVDDENEWIDAMKHFFNRTFTFEEYEQFFETLSIHNNHFIDIIDEFKEDI